MTQTEEPTASGNLAPRDGELYLWEGFLEEDEATMLFETLRRDLAWQSEEIVIAGRRIQVPRLTCWYGDDNARYTYSGVLHVPKPWTPALTDLRGAVEKRSGHRFNSVLGNLYRDGRDSMGWHADKEKELGRNPCIASVSLGAERLFKVRHNRGGEILDILLRHGSLLLMAGTLQHHWRHALPKTRKPTGPRINLTFRQIVTAPAAPFEHCNG